MQMAARNADLGDLKALLVEQHARKIDIVAPADKIRSEEGLVVVKGTEPILGDDGFTYADGTYRPTAVFDEGLADKFNIPLAYVRRLRAERPDLLDANVNGWLHGRREKTRWNTATKSNDVLREGLPGDPRSFMIRAFRADDGSEGVARALLSDRYQVIDHLDVLTAALDGVRQAGVHVEIDGCDLTERRMYVRIVAPEVQALAPTLLRGYRSPFSDPEVRRAGGWTLDGAREAAQREGLGYAREAEPIVFAGFVLTNSETGGGAFSIVPRVVVRVCRNGLQISKDAVRNVHLGGRLEEGIVRWSSDTQAKNLDLVTSKTRDAVATFLDTEYMERVISDLEEAAGKPVKSDAVKIVGKKLQFDEKAQDAIFDMFVRGGQMTAGGVVQAITAAAQQVEDADTAHDMEAKALRALEFVS